MAYLMARTTLLLITCLVSQVSSVALAQGGNLTLPDRPGDAVELTLSDALPESDLSDFLRVFVGPSETCCESRSPIAGTYRLDGQTVRFRPAFDFVTGQAYAVQTSGAESSLASFTIAAGGDSKMPEVISIHPSGPEIPENTLRFYIEFSTPMMPHMSDRFIRLLDADGATDAAAFMSFTQELWSADRTRLTLLMDPGRIKRGVAQNLSLGPALLEGRRYSIVIDEGWPSANGGRKLARFEHAFTVSTALRTLPDTRLWQIQPPRLATKEPLVIAFDRPFDQQLAQSAITVLDAEGQPVAGAVSISDSERRWRFQPDDVWSNSNLSIRVGTHLEDVAGNNFRDLLDHSVGIGVQPGGYQVISVELN